MSWFKKLKDGLKKTSTKISDNISSVISKQKLDQDTLDALEDVLIMADFGAQTASEVIEVLSKNKFNKEISPEEVKEELASILANILTPVAKKLTVGKEKPFTILAVGVNGNGKTTTIGKLAAKYHEEERKVTIAACDTFRAAAVEQLQIWANRAKAEFVSSEINGDPASVAYKALETAKNNASDVLMIDTAGRLHNKSNLMSELNKINRVLKKHGEQYPHETLLVIDATTGQNALNQVEEFNKIVKISGLVVTKLDGSAKAGIIVAIAKKFAIPIYAVGVGEKVEDLNDFDAKHFARNLVGL